MTAGRQVSGLMHHELVCNRQTVVSTLCVAAVRHCMLCIG